MSVHARPVRHDRDEQDSHSIEDAVEPLAVSCLTCGSILPTDTTTDSSVECPRCRHVTEVDR